jgi:hypothetical protein
MKKLPEFLMNGYVKNEIIEPLLNEYKNGVGFLSRPRCVCAIFVRSIHQNPHH